jgi:hypothetical protein
MSTILDLLRSDSVTVSVAFEGVYLREFAEPEQASALSRRWMLPCF